MQIFISLIQTFNDGGFGSRPCSVRWRRRVVPACGAGPDSDPNAFTGANIFTSPHVVTNGCAFADRKPGTLANPHQQRITLAIAITHQQRIAITNPNANTSRRQRANCVNAHRGQRCSQRCSGVFGRAVSARSVV
jgi:hypothetical protein